MGKYIFNPFIICATSFIISLISFKLEWSYSYQKLDIEFIAFICIFILINIIIGVLVSSSIITRYREPTKKSCDIIFVFFIIGMILDFIYSGNIGIYNLITGSGTYYKDIKHIPLGGYVIILSIGAYLQILLFSKYIFSNCKRSLYLSLICLLLLCTTGTRSILLLCAISSFIIYVKFKFQFNIRSTTKIIVFTTITILIFSFVGNVRSDNYKNQSYMKKNNVDVSNIVMHIGNATDEFKNSKIPKGMFWVYAYTASPLSNLNSVINYEKTYPMLDEFLLSNLAPNLVTKILGLDTERDKSSFILDVFNTYTILGTSAVQYGYLGICAFYLLLILSLLFLILLCSKLPYNITILSMLGTTSLFCMFANMYNHDILFFIILFTILSNLFGEYFFEY